MISSAYDGTVRLWSPEMCSLEQTLVYTKTLNLYGSALHGEPITQLGWSPTGRYLCAAIGASMNIWHLTGKINNMNMADFLECIYLFNTYYIKLMSVRMVFLN